VEALSAFIRAPLLREASKLFWGDIAILSHLLLNSLERNILMNKLEPLFPDPEAEALRETWSSHLAHEGAILPNGASADEFFIRMFTNSPHNPGGKAEAAKILRFFISDTIHVATLKTPTVGAIKEETMDQSACKRARGDSDTEDACELEGTCASAKGAQMLPQTTNGPLEGETTGASATAHRHRGNKTTFTGAA
jgi:hypothetical protein